MRLVLNIYIMNDLDPIKRKIYEIRGRRVMLDSDLADLYNVETKNLKRAVRANMERFPEDFMFELTKEEYDSLRCKFFTSNKKGGNRYLPFAFTREGIAMLSGLLRSDQTKRRPIGFRQFNDDKE